MTLFLLLLSFILYPLSFAFAQVAVDGTTTFSSVYGGATLTFSKTVSGSNRYLVVGFLIQSSTGPTITSVTFNGVALTQKTYLNDMGGTGNDLGLYETLTQPAATTANVVITTDAADGCGGACTSISAGATSFSGVNLTTPSGTAQTGNDFFNTPVSVTVPANGMAFNVVGQGLCDTPDPTPTDEQTQQWNECADPTAAQSAGATTSTSGTLPWTDASGTKGQIAVAINPAAAAGVARRRAVIIQ